MTQPTTTPTAEPVPSKRPQNLLFNAELWDIIMAGDQATVTDRKGQSRLTYKGAIQSLMGTNPRGAWSATPSPGTYALNDLVVVSTVVYKCTLAHTPSGSFATDLAAGKWAVHKGITAEDLALTTALSGIAYSPVLEGPAVWTDSKVKITALDIVSDGHCIADSNGTPGSGTNNAGNLQDIVEYCKSRGRRLVIPAHLEAHYRIASQIDFAANGANKKMEFVGESILNSVIYADITTAGDAPIRAALSLDNPEEGDRSYVAFKNFRLNGRSNARTNGIYIHVAGSFSELENVAVYGFHDGIAVAKDYFTKARYCISHKNLRDGLRSGFLQDDTIVGNFNLMVLGGSYDFNGGAGIHVESCRALGIYQSTSEANTGSNIHLARVYGGHISGTYKEHEAEGIYDSQLHIEACLGIEANFSCSGFKSGAGPVVKISNGSANIKLSGAIEKGFDTVRTCTAVEVSGSFGVKLDGLAIDGCAKGLELVSPARVEMDNVNFSNCITPVTVPNSSSCTLEWKGSTPALVAASSIGAAAKVDLTDTDLTKTRIDEVKSFNVSVTYTDVLAGTQKNLITHALPGERWRVINITVGPLEAGNAGGDQFMDVRDGTTQYTVLTPTVLKATAVVGWGSTSLPYPSANEMAQPTVAGSDLYVRAYGGLTDYTAGAWNFTVTAQRVA